jgi:DNA-binding beta-propeller fold protein YncE
MVVDEASGKLLGEIPGLSAAHGTALDDGTGHGFATSGRDSSVVMFDLKTLTVLGRTTAADDADAITYDPVSKLVFTFNGDANSSSVIDPETGKRVGTIGLGGKPEYGVPDGRGKLYATLPIGAGVDASAFDPGTQDAFASNGDGTLTVVHEDAPDRFRVVQTVTTMPGARTMALDPRSHRLYLVSAQFGPTPTESTAANPRRRPPVVPGSFTLLVLEK